MARRIALALFALTLIGLGWWWLRPAPSAVEGPTDGPDTPTETARTKTPTRPPVAGAQCRVRGVVEGGVASQVSLHSVRAAVDVSATLVGGGRGFHGALPEQGAIEVVVRADDGRSASVRAQCDGSGLVTVTVRLPEAKSLGTGLTGRCVYLETGVAVADARVLVRGVEAGDGPGFGGVTDEGGRFEVAAPAGVYRVTCGKDGDESESARVTVEPGVAATLELFLAARAGITGTVRDADGPVAGLTVVSRPAREGVDGREVEAITDAEGQFFAMGLPPGPVRVEAQDQGRFAEGHGVARVELPYANVDLLLEPAKVVVEGVVTADGIGVDGATVEVTTIRDLRGRRARGRSRRAVRTQPDGSYAIGGLRPGRARVEARAPGRTSASVVVQLVEGRTRADLGLPEACETQIRVEPAEPSRPVFVRIHKKGELSLRASGRTGADIVVSSPPIEAVITARSVGRAVATATTSATLCGAPVVLDLRAAEGRGALEVRAVSPDGAPVRGVRVWVNTAGGLAETPEDGRVRFEGLSPKTYRVGTRDAEPIEVEVFEGQTAQAELVVAREQGEVTGTVVAGGAPVEGAAILAACADSGRPPSLSRARVRARSDGSGAFTFVPDDGGVCAVRAEHRSRGRSQSVLLRAGGEPGRIDLEGSATLSGRVVTGSDRAPVPDFTLRVDTLGGTRSIEGRTLQVRDPDGRFEVVDLAPGRVAVSVDSPAGRARAAVDLAPGERRDGLELTIFGNARVRGRVMDPRGRPIPRARVRIEAYRRALGRTVTGPDGRFSFLVPSGDPLRVYASAPDYYPRGTEAFDLDPAGTDLGDLVLEPRGGDDEKEGGIGIMFGGEADGIRIIRFTDDSPAREAGLESGDLITAIDGVPFGRDPLVNWVVTLRGPVGTPVVLQIRRGTQSPFSSTVIRRSIGLEAVPSEAP